MTEEQEGYVTESPIPEAPASLNIRFASEHGFECMLTLRHFDEEKGGKELLRRLRPLEELLHKKGCKPIFGKNATPKPTETKAEGKPEEIECPIHPNVFATLKTGKDGAQWYSHKLDDGSWCNAKEKK